MGYPPKPTGGGIPGVRIPGGGIPGGGMHGGGTGATYAAASGGSDPGGSVSLPHSSGGPSGRQLGGGLQSLGCILQPSG